MPITVAMVPEVRITKELAKAVAARPQPNSKATGLK
jgi:hypothetical protein